MSKVLQYALRFGPLVAGFALGLAAILEPIIPGYTGIITTIMSALGFVGVQSDSNMAELVSGFVAGVVVLVGVVRKVWAKVQAAKAA